MSNKTILIKKILIIFLSAFILLTTIHSIGVNVIMRLSQGIKPTFYKTFSFDSNILMAITSIITIVFVLINFKKNEIVIPKWLVNLFLGSVTSIMFTFFIVMLYLGPFIEGFEHMLSVKLIFLHLFNPIFSVILFCLLLKEKRIEIKEFWIGLIPMLVFAVYYIVSTYILKISNDIYRLNAGGLGFIIIPGMIAIISGISIGLIALRNIKKRPQ